MRVLHLLNDVTDRGNGIVNAAVDLAIAQVQLGYDVAVASAGGGYVPLLTSRGVRHLTLDQPRRLRQVPWAIETIRRHLRDFEPDAVHAHMRTGLLLAWALKWSFPFSLVGHVHNVHDRESILMGLADRVIAVSESVGASMSRQLIPKRKIRVVLNRTLGSSRVPPLRELRAATLMRPAIVTVCGMSTRKGIEELLRAFELIGSEIRDAHLYLVGDGPERERFENLARRSQFQERIHFEGYQCVPQGYMLSADVFVLASRRESFGLVLIEAREAGCAIVATNVDGISEALDGGNAGVLVRTNDDAALADAIRRILCDKALREQLQRKAMEGLSRFRVDRMALEMQDVYDEVVATRKQCSGSAAMPRNKYPISDAVKRQSLPPADGPGSAATHS